MRMMKIEDVEPGMVLDMGTFAERLPGVFQGQPNPLTWDIRLAGGAGYTETRSTDERPVMVRVWRKEGS